MTLQQLRQAITIADSKSMNEAAKKLFLSQPSLSAAVKELEEEIGITIFIRSNRGITVTPQGIEFLGYARQVIDQYELLEEKYIAKTSKKYFSVSTQHYTFAVKAFVEMVKKVGMEEYEFAIHETRTDAIIQAVKEFKSEVGIIYLNDLNEQVISKMLRDKGLEFVEILECDTFVYLWEKHPLAKNEVISMSALEAYPCIAFSQGDNDSFYLSEEMKSNYEYKQMIRVDDRATALNLILGLNGYTLCSGITCNELNGENYITIPLQESDKMRIGYIKRKGAKLSSLGSLYIEEISKYNNLL